MLSDVDHLNTLIGSAFNIRNYIGPLTVKEFRDLHHGMQRDAVVWRFQVVVAAARRVSAPLKAAHPEIPWRRLTEDYGEWISDDRSVDFTHLWQTGTQELPNLIPRIVAMLRSFVPPEEPDERQ